MSYSDFPCLIIGYKRDQINYKKNINIGYSVVLLTTEKNIYENKNKILNTTTYYDSDLWCFYINDKLCIPYCTETPFKYCNEQYYTSIHPQAFKYIIYGDSGCPVNLLDDICNNQKISEKIRLEWLKLNYNDRINKIREYFNYIKNYLIECNDLHKLYNECKLFE